MRLRFCFGGALLAAFLMLGAPAGLAQTQDEARAKALFAELRCVVCQNQSILESDADVAKDLRQIVREQIASGRTDQQIRQFLTDRYGEFILLKPLFSWHTALLWLAPFLMLAIGCFALVLAARRRKTTGQPQQLTAEEEERLSRLVGTGRSSDRDIAG